MRRGIEDRRRQVALVLGTTRSLRRPVRIGMLPFLQQSLGLLDQFPLLARLNDVPVGLEERADVERLAPPYVAVDGPVEGELQGASVEGEHDGLVARHCCFRREAAARSCSSNWVGDASDGVRGGLPSITICMSLIRFMRQSSHHFTLKSALT